METKICTKCGVEKNIDCFVKEKKVKSSLRNQCKDCKKEYLKEYYLKNKDKATKHNKEYYFKNKDKILLVNKEYRLKNKDKIKQIEKEYRKQNKNIISEKKKTYYENNKKEILDKSKQYYKNNKEKIIEKNTKYYEKNKNHLMDKAKIRNAKRKKEDYIYKLKCQIRSMIKDCFKRKKTTKNQNSEKILGCSIKYFQKYLLETYKKNYGIEWDGIEKVHIDHIIPLSTANTEESIIKLCHYSNLQLLKAKDNLNKRDKLDWELK